MRVRFICGYYSDLAKSKAARPEVYWDAYFFVWAVKTGLFKRPFSIHFKNGTSERITSETAHRPREIFGKWIAREMVTLGANDAYLVPVPSKDAIRGAAGPRSLVMLRESLRTGLAGQVLDGLRWSKQLPKAHEGGNRRRDALLPYLQAANLAGKRVVLVDELFSTGGSLLACREKLIAEGAEVAGALTCGRTVYNLDTKPFETQEVFLTEELADWRG